MFENALAVPVIDEGFGKSFQGEGFGLFQQRIDGVFQNVLRPRAPIVRPEVPENADDGGDDKGPLAWINRLQNVQTNDVSRGGRVDVDDVVGAVPGNDVEN